MAYTQEQFLGAGVLYLDVLDSDGNSTGAFDVGNAINFAINAPVVDKKERKGFRQDNYAKTIKSVITKVDQDLKFTLTDINKENLALAMFGTSAAYTQSAVQNQAQASITFVSGKTYKLAHRKLDPAEPPTIPTFAENTDFEVDYQAGLITSLTIDAAAVVTYDALDITDGYKVDGLEVSKIEAYIRLVGEDQANSRDCEVIVYKAQIESASDIKWLSEDLIDLEFTGKILDTTDGNWDVLFY